MSQLCKTPKPPYYAVIFASVLNKDMEGYKEASERMIRLASAQKGFLGVDTSRSEIGITVSYWKDLSSIHAWRINAEHIEVKNKGKSQWYKEYSLRIAKVEQEY